MTFMGTRPTIPDVESATLILADVTEISDALTAEEAVEFRIAAEKVRDAAIATIRDLNTQIIKVLEGKPDIVRGGRQFYIGRKKDRERHDHSAIAGGVMEHIRRLVEPDFDDPLARNGVRAGARVAIDIMSNLYLSESTKAKIGQLDRYDIPRDPKRADSVRTWIQGDKVVVDIPAGGQPDSEDDE